MRWIGSVDKWTGMMAIALFITPSCTSIQSFGSQSAEPLRTIEIQQTWQLQPGDVIGTHRVVAGLGEISIDLNGGTVYAPFNGRVEPTVDNCVLFSSPDVPAYLFRFCGLNRTQMGELAAGSAIGSGQYLHFATLRRQPDGTWTMVEPAKNILERVLK